MKKTEKTANLIFGLKSPAADERFFLIPTALKARCAGGYLNIEEKKFTYRRILPFPLEG